MFWKLTQSRRGLDIDILVLNPVWEQKILPDALKDLVHGMQVVIFYHNTAIQHSDVEIPSGHFGPYFRKGKQ
jgi:hypothetical protein